MTTPAFVIKLFRDYFRWLALGVVVLIVALGYGFFLAKKISNIQTTSFSNRDRAKNELTTAQLYAKRLQGTLDRYRQNFSADDLARLNRILPTATEFPDLLLRFQAMAGTAGLQLNDLTINTSPVAGLTATGETSAVLQAIPNLQATDVTMTVGQGEGYDQFKRFLNVLETSEPLVDVKTLTFTAPATDKLTAATYSFLVRTYSLPADQTPATETETAP